MKKHLLGALAAFLAGDGLAQAQYPAYPPPVPGYSIPYAPGAYRPAPYGAYPQMPPNLPTAYGAPMPYAPAIGRATVSDTRPVVHGMPMPGYAPVGPVAPGTPGNPIVIMEEKKGAAVQPIPTVEKERGPVVATPVGLRKRAASTAAPLAEEGSCGPECKPGHPMAGVPMFYELDCHGQPIPDIDLGRAPRGYRAYARADFLYWWLDTQSSPTLLNVTRPQGPLLLDAGSTENGERIGSRTTLGIWLDSCHKWALEGSFLWLADRNPSVTAGSPDTVARPFFNVATGAEALAPIIGAGTTGTATIETRMRFHTAELNVRRELCRFSCGHLDLLAGFRYLHLDEALEVNTATTAVGAVGPVTTSDRFSTRNNFYGGQLGLDGEVNWGRLYLNPYGKCALGVNQQFLSVAGNRVGPGAGGVLTSVPGGFLALPTNIGNDRVDELSIVPEVGLNLGYKVTENFRIMLGYTALALNHAARPGDQVNRNLNLTQLSPIGGGAAAPTGPLSPFRDGILDDWFLAQGVSFGFEFRW